MGSATTPVTTLLLARHAQSTWNAEGRWQGQADPPLSDFGREQSNVAAMKIGAVDLVASSPQLRALETASIISANIGVGPVVTVGELRERNAGPWSGMTRPEIIERYPNFLENDQRPEGYETDDSLLERTLTGLTQLVDTYPGATIFVVAHGGVIHNLELHLSVRVGRVPNLAGRVLEHHDGNLHAGEQLALLDARDATGGDPQRI